LYVLVGIVIIVGVGMVVNVLLVGVGSYGYDVVGNLVLCSVLKVGGGSIM